MKKNVTSEKNTHRDGPFPISNGVDVIVAVLRDLYAFVVTYHFGFKSASPIPAAEILHAHTTKKSLDEEFVETLKAAVQDVTPPSATGLLPPSPVFDELVGDVHFEGVGYAYSPDTYLYALPTRSFDGVIRHIAYGDSFQLLGTQGKWCNVDHDGVRGWVHRDDITENSIELKPQFVIGEFYDAVHPSTLTLRTFIDDAFHAAPLDLPLQNVDYVSFILKERGRNISWPPVRPRIAGTWKRILKGIPGVHMGVRAKTGAIMEYVLENNTGQVAFVDSVYPDEGITISEVGYTTEGVYSERTLSKEEWKELRPIFIQVL